MAENEQEMSWQMVCRNCQESYYERDNYLGICHRESKEAWAYTRCNHPDCQATFGPWGIIWIWDCCQWCEQCSTREGRCGLPDLRAHIPDEASRPETRVVGRFTKSANKRDGQDGRTGPPVGYYTKYAGKRPNNIQIQDTVVVPEPEVKHEYSPHSSSSLRLSAKVSYD